MEKQNKMGFKKILIIILTILNIGMIGLLGFYVVPTYRTQKLQMNELNENQKEELGKEEIKKVEKPETASFSFVGVGDNLIHDTIYSLQEKPYNFDNVYSNTNKYTKSADFSYMNAETLMIGEEYGLDGTVTFNGPTELMDSIANSGFDWISVCSEHSLDRGVEGLDTQLSLLDEKHPEISVTGSHREQDEEPVVRNINGINVGLMSYTFDTNVPMEQPWMIDTIDPDKIRMDLEELNAVSDVQMVSMHWGTEYRTEIEQQQKDLVKLLNEMGVEVVIGTHPHVIKPVEMYHGDEQDTLVYYSLGNFITAQNVPECLIGGMASFDLTYNYKTKETTFENVKFIPTVSFASTDLKTYRTNTIFEYTDEMAENQWQLMQSGIPCTKEFIDEFVHKVMEGHEDENIEVVYSE